MVPEWIRARKAIVRRTNGSTADDGTIEIRRSWQDRYLKTEITNRSSEKQQIREVVIAGGVYPVEDDCRFYAEGFQMLAQYTGTLTQPRVIGKYGSDNQFFKIPDTVFSEGFYTVYNCLYLEPREQAALLMAFTSSHTYAGQFRFRGNFIEAVEDMEDRWLQPGETWVLDEFGVFCEGDREALFASLAERLNQNHPPIRYGEIPFGWCSYHCINGVTAEEMYAQAAALKRRIPELQRIQIDAGYQSSTDWLIPNPSTGATMKEMCERIRALGVEPAGYLSPFLVDEDSALFREHPDWVVCDAEGRPFHEYTHVPHWYMLDGSNPEAVDYIRNVVRVMHDDWGLRYFKLDFTSYGALPGGVRHNGMTRIESFRRLFGAITQEVGGDSYILGCNAPFWPQLGLVHGNRETNDVFRRWETVSEIAEQQFWRNWQNGTLWINDPDGVVLEKRDMSSYRHGRYRRRISELSDAEFAFHRAYIVACGGVVTSGDLLTEISDRNLDVLRKMIRETGTAARFDDTTFTIGRIQKANHMLICAFNWADEPRDIDIPLNGRYRVQELFTEKELGVQEGHFRICDALPHEGFVLKLVPDA